MALEKMEPYVPMVARPYGSDNIFGNIDIFFDPRFWLDVAPSFTISEALNFSAFKLSDAEKECNKSRILVEGYTHLQNPGLEAPFPEMAALFVKLVDMGLPPAFAFVFDEFWKLSSQLDDFIGGVLHEDYAMLPDFWAWLIKPGASGFAPHRDKGPDSLFPDRRPKSLTVWLPITEAHPLNGCMYILPANRDRLYGVGQQFGGTLADIRALPGKPGDVFSWTQHAFHWSAHAADEHTLPPRMSVAFEFQRRDIPAYNMPLLKPGVTPPFERRLALIAKQVIQYKHLYGPTLDLLNAARTILAKSPL